MKYEDLTFKKPIESLDYKSCSDYVIHCIESIIKNAITNKKNKITSVHYKLKYVL